MVPTRISPNRRLRGAAVQYSASLVKEGNVMMNRKSMIALAAAAFGSAGMGSTGLGNTGRSPDFGASPAIGLGDLTRAVKPGQISVLTYNVGGLPWPIAFDRPANLALIGRELAELRATRRAPQVVVLQEAFTPEAQAIARTAGYRYTIMGPGIGDPRPAMPGYAPPRSILKGEAFGPVLPSGLVMMSDFKLSHIRRTAFPASACSGYDCLANKGILAARIAAPGFSDPIEVITAHFNSGNPSGQPEPTNRIAFERQLDALGRFVADDKLKRTIRIYAGDFNMGHSPARLSALFGFIHMRKGMAAAAWGKDKREGLCRTRPNDCQQGVALAANVPLRHANDWQIVTAPQDVQLNPIAREIMFASDRTGNMPSDHFGLKVTYSLGGTQFPIVDGSR
jgi:endonuclease/exonuclease/phosphatase family metal-dependent hydrolase